MEKPSTQDAWLVRISGSSKGMRHVVRQTVTTIGRHPECDISLAGPEASTVSTRHAEIRNEHGTYSLIDLESTNGSFLDGESVKRAQLSNGSRIRLGAAGPEFAFRIGAADTSGLDETVVLSTEDAARLQSPPDSGSTEHDELLSAAVDRARQVRESGVGGETMSIMREAVGEAVRKSSGRQRRIIHALIITLVLVIVLSTWRIISLNRQLSSIDTQIAALEARLSGGGLDEEELEQLIDRLDEYQDQAGRLQQSLFYKLGFQGREQRFIEREIKLLLAEFGAEQYSVPPEFTDQVISYVERFQNRDRETVEKAVARRREDIAKMKHIFASMKLPEDLVYMVMVESAFITQSTSSKGAAGLWQFTPATARAYGMRVNSEVDERHDLTKATEAAGSYIRELILEFGAGSSVMLAMAAYNIGPGKVRRAVRRVEDPIQQRNFWYLYRVRALPAETRQYVPKIIAAIIVGRNLERFGF